MSKPKALRFERDCLTIISTPRELELAFVSGHDADEAGGHMLQAMADEFDLPVICGPESEYHRGRIFWPGEKRK